MTCYLNGYPEPAVQVRASSSSGEAFILDSLRVIIVIYMPDEAGKKSGCYLIVLPNYHIW